LIGRYQLFCGWSGQVMIDQMYLMLFNLLFTSLPPVAVGVFDRKATRTPQLVSKLTFSAIF
jgi:phospholipid-translocating ATPase